MADATTEEHNVVETLKSLIVAFVLAMIFRGFVVEGFVIPTGSMAPTLMGAHHRVHSDQTGDIFPVGVIDGVNFGGRQLFDPMLGPLYGIGELPRDEAANRRMGDRILVLKSLFPFFPPDRFDIVVFKNPTDPNGPSGNYIKRLIGLPNETIWLADGDVFAAEGQQDVPAVERDFRIQRKPEHVQRAVWQPVFHSNYIPVQPTTLEWPSRSGGRGRYHPWEGSPWVGADWDTSGRVYATETAEPTMLRWDQGRRAITDWAPYNMLINRLVIPVSDLRVAAAITPAEEGLRTRLELETRGHVFEFSLDGAAGEAALRYRAADADPQDPASWINRTSASVDAFDAREVIDLEFWHVDQAMRLFIDGEEILALPYEWQPAARLRSAIGGEELEQAATLAADPAHLDRPKLRWFFEGSPLTLQRVRLDRDLYYQPATLSARGQNQPIITNPPYGFGTHPERLAELGPDHFMMLGDNSPASLDSRLWGSPHPAVARQIDPAPFVVHRDLLIGKAWVVYFPAPLGLDDEGGGFILDFGRMRFIR